jgi:hypothetical protein
VLASPPRIATVIATRLHAVDGAPAVDTDPHGDVTGRVGRVGLGVAVVASRLLLLPAARFASGAGCMPGAGRWLGRRAMPASPRG